MPVYVAGDPLIRQVLGFKFHTGVIAVGRRLPSQTLESLFENLRGSDDVTACPEVSNSDNIGALDPQSRPPSASTRLVLGERCHDPFWRQSIRVSMGTIFSMPLVRSADILRDVTDLRETWGVEMIATVLADDAEPLARAQRADTLGLLFGNEAQGLDEALVAACDRRVTIPMKLGTDSLNVAVSAAVFLYHFTRESAWTRARRGRCRCAVATP